MELIVLSIANWLHLLATVIWIGGMILFPFVVMPVAGVAIGPGPGMGKFISVWDQKFKAWPMFVSPY